VSQRAFGAATACLDPPKMRMITQIGINPVLVNALTGVLKEKRGPTALNI
jgi:hypothetical protein